MARDRVVYLDDEAKVDISSYFRNRPAGPSYRILANLLYDFALAWVSLHERAHVLQGHVDYWRKCMNDAKLSVLYEAPIPEMRTSTLTEQQSLLHQCLELDADYHAGAELLFRNTWESIWALYEMYPHPKNKQEAIILSIAMMLVTMAVLKKLETICGGCDLYPSADERIGYAILSLVPHFMDDRQAVFKGVLQAKRFLDRLPDHYLPTFTFTQESGFGRLQRHRAEAIRSVRDSLVPILSSTRNGMF